MLDKNECIRLRVEERLSLREIAVRSGRSKGTLSPWLKPYPLTVEEKTGRTPERRGAPRKDRGAGSKYAEMASGYQYTSLQRAKIAEAAVLYRLVIHGLNPFGSTFDGDKTDWLVEVPSTGKVHRIQVKTARNNTPSGLPTVSLRCSNGVGGNQRPYREGEFDFVVGHDLYTDTCYVWSWEDVKDRSFSITISPDAAERWDKLIGV